MFRQLRLKNHLLKTKTTTSSLIPAISLNVNDYGSFSPPFKRSLFHIPAAIGAMFTPKILAALVVKKAFVVTMLHRYGFRSTNDEAHVGVENTVNEKEADKQAKDINEKEAIEHRVPELKNRDTVIVLDKEDGSPTADKK